MSASAASAFASGGAKAIDAASAFHHPMVQDVFSRALNTFAQQFVVILLATGPGLPISQHWTAAVVTSLFAFAASILLSSGFIGIDRLDAIPKIKDSPHWKAGERVVRTFLQSFLGCMAASTFTKAVTYGWKASAAIAVCVAFLALLKGLATLNDPQNA